jgi:putative ATP-dependent endonuclease of the OLD family
LRRFLDATKANLFFARGLIIVEGDAENLLLPAIARKLGKPLSKFGVSIVNVGHRGLFRYSRIFQRRDGSKIPIPVALIPDRDIPPAAAKGLVGVRLTENEWEETKKAVHLADLKKDEGGAVAVFTSEQWTLEFDLARKPALAAIVHQAIKLAKGAANKTDQEIKDSAEAEITDWRTARKSDEEIAVLIFDDLYKKRASKAETAQRLAQLIDSLGDDAEAFKAKIPEYLSSAIDHATSFGAPSAALAPASGLASRC